MHGFRFAAGTVVLFIENVGGAALETRTSVATWLYVSLIGHKHPSKQTVVFPVGGYFTSHATSGGSVTGLLGRYLGYHNNQAYIDLERAAVKLADSRGFYLEMRLRTYAAVYYTDIFQKRQSRYYFVDSISGSVEVSRTEGIRLVETVDTSPDRVELGNLTPEQVLDLVEKRPLE